MIQFVAPFKRKRKYGVHACTGTTDRPRSARRGSPAKGGLCRDRDDGTGAEDAPLVTDRRGGRRPIIPRDEADDPRHRKDE
jgi:hypothetical protein